MTASLEDALTKSGIPESELAPRPETAGEVTFSPKKFADSIRKSPVWDVLDRDERFEVATAVRVFERIYDRAGTGGSQTAPLLFTMDMYRKLAKGLVTLNPGDTADAVVSLWTVPNMGRVLLDPIARRNLVVMEATSPQSAEYAKAAAYLSGLLATEDVRETAARYGVPGNGETQVSKIQR